MTVRRPEALGLPEQYSRWRPQQEQAVAEASSSAKRAVCQAVPCGVGKSVEAVALALMQPPGARTCVLTSTKALQDQYCDSFGPLLADLRGKANYQCEGHQDDRTCAEGYDSRCPFMETRRCPYHAAYTRFLQARIGLTNYSCWMSVHQYGAGLGKFTLLVLDEAHLAFSELSAAVGVELSRWDCGVLDSEPPERKWALWAQRHKATVAAALEEAKQSGDAGTKRNARHIRRLRDLGNKLGRAAQAEGAWIAGQSGGGDWWRWRGDPLWPAPYAEEYLFRRVPRLLLLSATATRRTCDLLGIADAELDYFSYPAVFDPARCPVYWVPTCRITSGGPRATTEQEYVGWAARIDQFIGSRLDRRGLVHSVSYERQRDIVRRSEHKDRMLAPEARELARLGIAFKTGSLNGKSVLVSPAIGTGWDFPYKAAEYAIIPKVPFPDSRDPLTAARIQDDPSFGNHVAAQALAQAAGRTMRAADDRGETAIVDDHVQWLYWRNRELFPTSFRVERRDTLPQPPLKL